MNRIAIRAYREGDLEEINPLSCYSSLAKDQTDKNIKLGKDVIYTVLGSNEKPLAVVGWGALYSKVAEVWAFTDSRVTKEVFRYARSVKFLIDHEFKCFEHFNRMQIVVRADQPWAESFAAFIGFSKDALLKKYGDESVDYFLFSRVRDDACIK